MAVTPVDNGLYQFKSADQAGNTSRTGDLSKIGQNKDNTSLSVIAPDTVFTSTSCDCKNPNFDLVHDKLEHTSVSKMHHGFICKQPLPGTFTCDICVLAKIHRLRFNKSIINTTSPFQLIHLDVWGPYRVVNVCGAHYFLTIFDDFTRIT